MMIAVRTKHHRYSQKVTSSKRWKVLRMAILERDGYRCKCCGIAGRLEIDHIRPVRTHPALSFDPSNLQSLCASCHTKKTRIECGHPAPIQTPARDAWAKAVADLATNSKPSIIGDTNA